MVEHSEERNDKGVRIRWSIKHIMNPTHVLEVSGDFVDETE